MSCSVLKRGMCPARALMVLLSFKEGYNSRGNYGNDKIYEQMEELRKLSKRNTDYQSREEGHGERKLSCNESYQSHNRDLQKSVFRKKAV